MSSEPAKGPSRIHSLDGLRALSILLVIYGHARGSAGFPAGFKAASKLGDVADFGVRVFFVISGYLITSLLAGELRKTGTVRLGSFYARRAFRIFPAYYAFLAVMIGLWFLGIVELSWFNLALAATYTINFWHARAWAVGHAWSLSVEEQFYLIWPAVFRRAGEKGGLRVALAVVVLGPVVRGAWAALASPAGRLLIPEAFPTVADALATGCALTLLGPALSKNERYLRWLRSPMMGAALLVTITFCIWFGSKHPWAEWLALQSVMAIAIALLIDRYTRFPDGPFGRFLNWRPLAFLGTLSYSLYLWQQLFLVQEEAGKVIPVWAKFPQNVGLALAAALVSYYAVEKPFLQWRDRVLRPKARPAPKSEAPKSEAA